MKINYKNLLLLFLMSGVFASCSKEEDDLNIPLLDLGGETWEKGSMDTWLDENFVYPYNIEVKYRFDPYELSLNRTLVPPMEEKVIPVMQTIRDTWIRPYEEEAGPNFIKKLSPKQFVLVGSPEYNDNGTIKLGTAEGGRKVVLYKINDFAKKDLPEVKQMLHTIHHEFAHILHQTIIYPEEYQRLSTGYTANWADYSMEDANARGFITPYARSSPDEDFVEMVSIMLIEGEEGFNRIIANIPEEVQPVLRKKEELVVRYFKEAWAIDFYELQKKTYKAITSQ